MQSTAVNTPATNKRVVDSAKKSSGKKLVQARLPFKIISSGTATAAGSIATEKEPDEPSKDGRKRKLSFDSAQRESNNIDSDSLRERSASKENFIASAKKKKITDEVDDIILLDDDDIAEDDDNNLEQEEKIEEKTFALNKNKPKASKESSKLSTPKSKVINDKDNGTPKIKKVKEKNSNALGTTNSPYTPKVQEVKGNKTNTPRSSGSSKKKTETPNSAKSKKKHTPGNGKSKADDAKASGSVTKVQIKLPLGNAKIIKRRKSKISVGSVEAEIIVSSDEDETMPVKRQKIDVTPKVDKIKENNNKAVNVDTDKLSTTSLDESSNTETETNSKVLLLEIGGNESNVSDSELDSRCSSSITINSKDTASIRACPTKDVDSTTASKTDDEKLAIPDKDSVVSISKPTKTPTFAKSDKSNMNQIVERSESTKDDEKKNEPTDVSVVYESSSDSESSSPQLNKTNSKQSSAKLSTTPKIVKEDENKSIKKSLTPKQMKLIEQRRKAREEKERRLQEEKLQKQREKEAKELERKREREEREEQRRREREEREEQKRKEREERDEQKRKEREEKEQKRLAEQEAKNEEKRKRNEVKEEELRKKEEERKRKEEADLKAKKESEAFQKFFKTKRTSNADSDVAQSQHQQQLTNSNQAHDSKTLAFRPFEVKGDMKLAPICRKNLSSERKERLEKCVGANDAIAENQDLYLAELKGGKITPGVWRRISVDTKVSDDDDVQIIDDELDRAGQAIVEEIHAPMERCRVKFYKFHENRRPPYYGTWRKRTNIIRPRRPFVQDTKFFDYEVDSDLEWEEEEPGESLDGSDDEKEKESEDDDYEVDNEWFVPHGHLSEEELQNEDDDVHTREAQKAKLQVLQQEFAQEMKKKTEKIKPRLIGCIWADENGNQPALCPKIIWDTVNNRAMLCQGPPLLEDPDVPEKSELGSSPTLNGNEKTTEKIKPIKITERMLNDLVRLVHGNHHSKNFLIKEFIAYLEGSEDSIKNGEVRGPLKSLVREKIDEFAEWTITESSKVSEKNKNKNKKRLCWVVSADILKKMELDSLNLHNTWKYTLQPKSGNDGSTKVEVEAGNEAKETAPRVNDGKIITNNSESQKKVKSVKIKNASNQHTGKKSKINAEIIKFTKVLPTKVITQNSPKSDSTTPQTKQDLKPLTNASTVSADESKSIATVAELSSKVKKRVPLLMSVARGQQISQPTKNALISEFLKKSSAEKNEHSNKKASDSHNTSLSSAPEMNEAVELD